MSEQIPPKVTLKDASLEVYATDARASVVYLVDLSSLPSQSIQVLDADIMNDALSLVQVPIGSSQLFTPVVGPAIITNETVNPAIVDASILTTSLTIHQMRAWRKQCRPLGGQGFNKFEVQVDYQSKPRPTIELGASSIQTRTSTYLQPNGTNNNNFPQKRKQMVIDGLLRKGIIANNAALGQIPPQDMQLPLKVVTGQRSQFSQSLRISSTFYSDECSLARMQYLQGMYANTVNKDDFLIDQDARMWLCTAVNCVTNDGGYSIRASAEFVLNLDGWDTLAVYTIDGQPVILSDASITRLYKNLNSPGAVPSPVPSAPDQSGEARFPQVPNADHLTFAKFMAQSANPLITATNQNLNFGQR